MKKYFFGLLTGIILTISIVVIADTINSNEVLYDNTLSTSSATDVKGAIDDLYNKVLRDNAGYRLIGHIDESLSDELIAGLYRYQGVQDNNSNVDNYICFGTTDKNTCISDTDRYMYRIIGIGLGGQMKLIKKEALNTAYAWSSTIGVTWPNSDLYAGLNGNYFLTNSTYVPSGWENRIATANWHYATQSTFYTAAEISNMELSANSISAKIGIMYLGDYYYGLKGGRNCYSEGSSCATSWIHISKNDSNPPNDYSEWVITRADNNQPWRILATGAIFIGINMSSTASVRPVFYLNSTETIASGSGTITDPYILN